MFNCLYKHLLNNNILYKKQFGFQENHSADHAIIQLVDQISNSLEKSQFTLGVFMDLSKAFDTVDHVIFISKIDHYRVKGRNFLWFKNYLHVLLISPAVPLRNQYWALCYFFFM